MAIQRKKAKFLLMFGLTAFFLAGCSSKPEKPAKLRIGEFLFSHQKATISFQRKGQEVFSKKMGYANLSDYHDFKPGKYTISVKVGGKAILESKYGLGKKAKYTLCLYGIPKKGLKKNFQTTKDHLRTIFAGGEAHTPNGNMPKMRLLDDSFQKGKTEAQTRWLHFAPGVKPLTAKYQKRGKKPSSFSSKAYPKAVTDKALKPGNYNFSWKFKGSPQTVAKTTQEIEARHYYTFFVLGKLDGNAEDLQVVTGITDSHR